VLIINIQDYLLVARSDDLEKHGSYPCMHDLLKIAELEKKGKLNYTSSEI